MGMFRLPVKQQVWVARKTARKHIKASLEKALGYGFWLLRSRMEIIEPPMKYIQFSSAQN